MLFPTDLTSFLDIIRQNGEAVYSLLFAYATSHSLLLGLFAGYAAHAGALSVGKLVGVFWFGSFVGDAVRFYLGRRYGALRRQFGHLCVLGGCCGTDHRHVEQISLACTPVAA